MKLARLDEWNLQRRQVAAELDGALRGTGLKLPEPPHPGTDHVYHQYVVGTDARDALRSHLEAAGIGSGVHYPVPIHHSAAYAALTVPAGSLPNVESLAGRICSLPIYPGMTANEVNRVAEAVEDFNQARSAAAA